MIDQIWMWAIFFVILVIMFALDLGIFNKGPKHIGVKKALKMTIGWITLALLFGVFIFFEMGSDAATEYYAAYAIEKMMSVDNLFVFIIIFAYFNVPDEYQHKALVYGIVGALVFRAIFILLGAELLNTFQWMVYVFGIILIITAIKTASEKKEKKKDSKLAEILSKHFNVSPDFDSDKLITRRNGARMITPLLLCIVVIELTDIMFAFDSIPAALAITTDIFIIYTSNIFAVLGLRSLYFAIKGSMEHLEYMKYGLGAILAFVGLKMLLSDFIEIEVLVSLAVILSILAITVVASLYMRKKKLKEGPPAQIT